MQSNYIVIILLEIFFIQEQNKQVKEMNIYSVKQRQNIIIKIKMKEHKIGKKVNTGRKLNEIYIIAFNLSVRQLLVWLSIHKEKLFS